MKTTTTSTLLLASLTIFIATGQKMPTGFVTPALETPALETLAQDETVNTFNSDHPEVADIDPQPALMSRQPRVQVEPLNSQSQEQLPSASTTSTAAARALPVVPTPRASSVQQTMRPASEMAPAMIRPNTQANPNPNTIEKVPVSRTTEVDQTEETESTASASEIESGSESEEMTGDSRPHPYSNKEPYKRTFTSNHANIVTSTMVLVVALSFLSISNSISIIVVQKMDVPVLLSNIVILVRLMC